MASDIETRPMYIPPSRMTPLMGVANAANGRGAYELEPMLAPDFETGSILAKLDAIIDSDPTEQVIENIDALIEGLEATRRALIESRNEQIAARNEVATDADTAYKKLIGLIPRIDSLHTQLVSAELDLKMAQDQLATMRAMREKIISEAEDLNAALAPAEVMAAHDKAAEMLRQEGPVLYDVTEKAEWLKLCKTDFDTVADEINSIFDLLAVVRTDVRLMEHEVRVDAAAKDRTAKRIGKAAVLVSQKTSRDWFGRKSKRLIDTTARTITNNAGPSVTVRREYETEEGDEA